MNVRPGTSHTNKTHLNNTTLTQKKLQYSNKAVPQSQQK